MDKELRLKELAGETPVVISKKELIEVFQEVMYELIYKLEQEKEVEKTLLTRRDVMKMFNVAEATLWRWAKDGYLVPLNCGGKRLYKMSDVKRILEGEK